MPETDPAVEALRALVRIPTVSLAEEGGGTRAQDPAAFDRLHAELERQFPRLHAELDRERIAEHGLLFHWHGTSAERPVVLMAHQDVVPIDETAPWQHPPFGAEVHDGAVWGRGTLDDKGALAAICSAVERLLADGATPAQDVWLFFGAREEVSGPDAREAVERLREHGVRPWFVLDEGGAIAADAFPGVARPLGVVGVSEKGTTTLRLTAEGRGGHSSTPARNGPTTRIARAVVRLEKHPFPARLPDATVDMLGRLAPYVARPLRPLLGPLLTNADRLRPVLTRALVAAGAEPAALVRTTMAVTTLAGSPAHNVIASSASAGVNLRILTGDTVASATEHVRRAIADDSIEVEVVEANEPSPVSPVDDDAFRLLTDTIAECFPDAIPTPYIMLAATDARFFTSLCDRVYRFAPFRMSREQRQSIHSFDEHVGVEGFLAGVEWFHRLIERLPA